MAIISICPKCQGSIQLADDLSNPAEKLRCPRCSQIFLLHQALDIMAESPPEALPLFRPLVSSQLAYPAQQPAAGAPGPGAPGMAPQGPRPQGPTGSAYSAPAMAPGFGVRPPEPVQQPAESSIMAAGQDYEDSEPGYIEPESMSANMARKQRDQPSIIGHGIGVIGGGVVGIYLGAFVLNWLGVALPSAAHKLPGLGLPPPAGQVAPPEPDTPRQTPIATLPRENTLPPEKLVVEPAPVISPAPPKVEPPAPKVEPVKTKAPVEMTIGVRNAATVTPAQLGETLGEANQVSGGQVGKGSLVATLDPDVYDKLCELAQRTTFVKAEPGDKTLENRQSAIKTVFRRVAGTRDHLVKLGNLASLKLAAPPAPQSGGGPSGIVLAGVVRSIKDQGKLTAVTLVLYGSADTVTVMCPVRLGMKDGDKVVILGAIVDNPQTNLAGYTGADPRVVWGAMPVDIPPNALK